MLYRLVEELSCKKRTLILNLTGVRGWRGKLKIMGRQVVAFDVTMD